MCPLARSKQAVSLPSLGDHALLIAASMCLCSTREIWLQTRYAATPCLTLSSTQSQMRAAQAEAWRASTDGRAARLQTVWQVPGGQMVSTAAQGAARPTKQLSRMLSTDEPTTQHQGAPGASAEGVQQLPPHPASSALHSPAGCTQRAAVDMRHMPGHFRQS